MIGPDVAWALPPILNGISVVGFILVFAVALYLGYALAERYLADRIVDTITQD